ncbi:multiheme c-type cytochrome [Oligoflexia bacterium]|nr:multiheme c-type cytochrome [Oligoflexia bacterium]
MIKMTALLLSILIPFALQAQSIVSTKHNLSASGPGTVKADKETEICIFCHTPHNSSPRPPLWNKPDPGQNYTLYGSSTIQATLGQPGGSSLLCLSCHDGTIALGNVLSRPSDIAFTGNVTTMPLGTTNLSTDLSDDHPISFVYDSALANADGELVDPQSLTGLVQLRNQKMECTACHDPHANAHPSFLLVSAKESELCLYCHQTDYWNSSSHRTSNATWNNSGTDPWFHTPYTSVRDNACENCHNPHTASGHTRLLNFSPEEVSCLVCHSGTVASTNIQAQLTKPYRHDVYNYNDGVHDPEESNVVQARHVECSDCHNPHAVVGNGSSAPNANGRIKGVKGVNTNGSPVDPISYEYELCYRCHADSFDKPGSSTLRQAIQSNVRLEFDQNNPSFHPVEGPGQNSNVPSLISPYTESSKIFCTDCHASNGSGSPAGPHGSIYPQLLKYNYSTSDNTPESYQAYELCYQCHNRAQIINGTSNFAKEVHREHIVGEDVSCNTCHDPHGISSSQGSSTNNSHLINFDISVVSPDSSNRLEFVDGGSFAGECYLDCHGEEHTGDPEFSY